MSSATTRTKEKKNTWIEEFYFIYHELPPTIIIFISSSSFSFWFSFATMQWTREQTYRNDNNGNNNKMGLSFFPLPVYSLFLDLQCFVGCWLSKLFMHADDEKRPLILFCCLLCVFCIYINGFSYWFVLIFLPLSQGCANV